MKSGHNSAISTQALVFTVIAIPLKAGEAICLYRYAVVFLGNSLLTSFLQPLQGCEYVGASYHGLRLAAYPWLLILKASGFSLSANLRFYAELQKTGRLADKHMALFT